MMHAMKRRFFGFILIAMSVLLIPAAALAQDAEDSKVYDARLENYASSVTLENSSTALLWILLVLMAAVCVGVMFKNAKRTHLD